MNPIDLIAKIIPHSSSKANLRHPQSKIVPIWPKADGGASRPPQSSDIARDVRDILFAPVGFPSGSFWRHSEVMCA
jgi:hypothetical protein